MAGARRTPIVLDDSDDTAITTSSQNGRQPQQQQHQQDQDQEQDLLMTTPPPDDDDDDDDDDDEYAQDSDPKRATEGFCDKCGARVGEFYNSWHQITMSYYLPAMLGSYSCKLIPRDKHRTANRDTVLKGCAIQPLACPKCFEVLAFTVVDIPDPRQAAFRHRDFFKLSRVILKCEGPNPKTFTTVQPQVVPTPDNFQSMPISEDLGSNKSERASETDMEVESARPSQHAAAHPPPPSSSLPDPSASHRSQHHSTNATSSNSHLLHHHHHSPLQPVESNRQPAPSQSPALPSPNLSFQQQHQHHGHPQKTLSHTLPSPVQKPSMQDSPYTAHPKDVGAPLSNRTRELPRELPPITSSPVESHRESHRDSHRPNGQYYPIPPHEVQLDAIERLQTQISHNGATLAAHSRDMERFEKIIHQQEDNLRREFSNQLNYQSAEIRRVDEAIGRLQHEIRGVHEMMQTFSRDVHAARELQGRPMAGGAPIPAVDTAMELMSNRLATVSQKANEIDTIKVSIEILRSKLDRLEKTTVNSTTLSVAPTAATRPLPSPVEPRPTQSPHMGANYASTPVHPNQRVPSFQSVATPDVPLRPVPAPAPTPAQSGWVPVNQSAKRAHDSPSSVIGQPLGSPKRPKLAPIEPRMTLSSQPLGPSQTLESQPHATHPHTMYDPMDTAEARGRPTLQTPHRSWESVAESAKSSTFIPYNTQDTPSDAWRLESQQIRENHRSPPRGRGRGSGARGRPRKSYPTDVVDHGVAPAWEGPDWHGVNQDGYYTPRSARGVVRRGVGGGGSASRASRPTSASGRAVSLGLQGVTTGPGLGMSPDPYAHTKKTRTKPTRNADGILIRKDGRPDMRSQSSAANLRKVHARKEEQKSAERSFTPTSGDPYSAHHPDQQTPSPTEAPSGASASAQKKHEMIMSKVFPHGLEQSREEHNYAKQLFGMEGGVTPSRSTGNGRQPIGPSPIKREPEEEQSRPRYPSAMVLDSQSPNNTDEDIEMHDHAGREDEGETPSGQSEGSDHYHDAPAQVTGAAPDRSTSGAKEGDAQPTRTASE